MTTLIILHGWQSSKEKWQRVKEEVGTQRVEVIVPDLPGFKKENELEKSWSLDDYVEWVDRFISKRVIYFRRPSERRDNNKKLFLVGHSFGGRVAIKFAVKYPERLQGLILVSAAGIKRKEPSILKVAFIFKKFSFLPGYGFFRKIFYKFILRKTDYLMVEGVMKETFRKVIEEDLTPLLSKIEVSTLILWGKKDKITPLSDAYLMKEKIENSKLEILKNIGHTPHLEKPTLLSQKIINFINQDFVL